MSTNSVKNLFEPSPSNSPPNSNLTSTTKTNKQILTLTSNNNLKPKPSNTNTNTTSFKITPEQESLIIKTYLPNNLSINSQDSFNMYPIYRSIYMDDLLASTYLLLNGADPNVKSGINLETPLYEAVDKSSIDHVKLLLNFNADPNIQISDGNTPLHLSVIKQNVLIVKLLLKHKANPNIQCQTYNQSPVHLAIKNNVDPTILLLLVQYNGSLVLRDKYDKKPIDYCNSEEMKNTLKKLKLQKEEIFKTPIKNNEFVTPNKNNNLSISRVNSKTLNSGSNNKKQFNFLSTAVLQEPGGLNINFIEFRNNNNNNNNYNNNNNNDEIKKDLFNTTSNKYYYNYNNKYNYNYNNTYYSSY